MTLRVDMTAMEASKAYSMRDEQEKYYRQMKSTQGCNRQGNWSEEGKTGRLLILFVSMIIRLVCEAHLEIYRFEG